MDSRRLPAAVLAAAGDRRGGAMEVAATALDGLLEVAADPPLLERAMEVLLAGQPAMAPIWHLANAAGAPDPPSALADLRRRLTSDADAAVATATSWLLRHLAEHPGTVATVSHSSLVNRVLTRLDRGPTPARRPRQPAPTRAPSSDPAPGSVPRWGSVAEPEVESTGSSTTPSAGSSTAPSVALVGADAIGPEAFLNATGTAELASRLPTLVVATPVKVVPAAVFDRLGGPGFEVVPLDVVAAVVIGHEVRSGPTGGLGQDTVDEPPGRPEGQ
jgi:hypothetical protein